MLRKTLGPKWYEITEECRELHNVEIQDLNSSRNIIRLITSRRMRWAGHAAGMEKREEHTGSWWANLREGTNLQDAGVDGNR